MVPKFNGRIRTQVVDYFNFPHGTKREGTSRKWDRGQHCERCHSQAFIYTGFLSRTLGALGWAV